MTEKPNFKDLVDIENLKEMVLANHDASGLPIGIIDAHTGEIYAGAGWQRICREFHRRNAVSLQRCIESDTRIAKNLKRGESFAYKCKNGLRDIGIPIFCLDAHIATLFLGQFFYENEMPDRSAFASQADFLGFDQKEYLAALDEVPVFSKDQVDKILRYNKALAEFISSIASKTYLLKHRGEEKYRNLVENSPGILYSFSEKRGGFFISNRVKDILGYSAEYLMAHPFVWRESIHPEDRTIVDKAIEGARKGEPFDIAYRIQDSAKRWHWFRDRSIGIIDSNNGVNIEGLATDITKEIESNEALKKSERKFRTIFDAAPIGIALVDAKRRPVMCNRVIEEMIGYRSEELARMTFRDFTHPDDIAAEEERYNDLFAGKTKRYSIEKRNVRKDGKPIWVTLNVAAIQNDEAPPSLAVAMVQDITNLKNTEEKLMRSNQELEQFAYAASHDLQAPLRSIVGFLQLLQSRCNGQLDEKSLHYIDRSMKAGGRMQTLISDLLALSRVSTKGGSFHQTDMSRLVQHTLEDLETIVTEKGARIETGRLPVCAVDANQIRSLFQNLILNALTYNQSDPPEVEIGFHDERGRYRFHIRDNGIGISSKFHEKIFCFFERLHTEREYPGTGLGLAISKKIVERHGGTIWVESEPRKGASFYFTIPKS